ncbi:flavodoxin [uncultured Limosilactobacillus sp.]|uniref:flavodoxin n=1 Tax=uncultured Limosilactobacillus sp. TaxID=2837629 RepID=UPI0025F5D93E|nr:flavodoxin [uncultured Limosilactobacillus sp.]
MAKTLIIYYSSTGYNDRIAKQLAAKTDADLFRIEPVEEYDHDMWAAWDIAKKEREEGQLPALKSGYPDTSQYQQILLGGPSWGYTLANPLQSFLTKADFAGKPVYPWVTFYDHDEKYAEDLRAQLHNGQVQDLLELPMSVLDNQPRLDQTLTDWLTQMN